MAGRRRWSEDERRALLAACAQVCGGEMPDWVAQKQTRLVKFREAKAALEDAAKTEAEQIAAERAQKERGSGKKASGVVPKALSGEVDPKAQRNFTDPESRILRMSNRYVQGDNAQAVVDACEYLRAGRRGSPLMVRTLAFEVEASSSRLTIAQGSRYSSTGLGRTTMSRLREVWHRYEFRSNRRGCRRTNPRLDLQRRPVS
jgi:hypothetical protein